MAYQALSPCTHAAAQAYGGKQFVSSFVQISQETSESLLEYRGREVLQLRLSLISGRRNQVPLEMRFCMCWFSDMCGPLRTTIPPEYLRGKFALPPSHTRALSLCTHAAAQAYNFGSTLVHQ